VKKSIIILLGLVVIGSGGYFLTHFFFPEQEISFSGYFSQKGLVFFVSEDVSEDNEKANLLSFSALNPLLIEIESSLQGIGKAKRIIEILPDNHIFIGYENVQNSSNDWKKTIQGKEITARSVGGHLFCTSSPVLLDKTVLETKISFDFFDKKNNHLIANIQNDKDVQRLFPFVNKGMLSNWRGSFRLGLQSTHDEIYLDGIAQETEDLSFLSCLKRQGRLDFSLDKVMSDKTASLSFFSMTDGLRFRDDLQAYFYQQEDLAAKEWEVLKKDYDIDLSQLFYLLEGQVGLARLYNEGKSSQLLYLPSIDDDKIIDWWKSVDQKMALDSNVDTNYNKDAIHSCGITNFSEVLLGKEFRMDSMQSPSYMMLDGYCVIGEKFALRQLLDDYEEDEVWARSVEMSEQLRNHISPCSWATVANPHFFSQLLEGKEWLLRTKEFDKAIERQKIVVLEFSWEGDDCLVDFSISEKGETSELAIHTPVVNEDLKDSVIEADTLLMSKPYIMTNHATKKKVVMVVDASLKLYMYTMTGRKEWTKHLGDNLVTNLVEVDWFRNGKKQYLMATVNKIFCVDRLGRDVEGFPWLVPEGESIADVSVLDYDRNKKYRVLLTTLSGKLYLYDTDHKNLVGWQPQETKEEFVTAPRHIRVKGKDYIVGLQKSGKVIVKRRNGNDVPHFPKEMDAKPISNLFMEKGVSFEDTYFTALYDDGEIKKVNLYGELASHNNMTVYAIPIQVVGGGLVFVEFTKGDMVVYDTKYKQIFKRSLVSEDYAVQAYRIKNEIYFFVRNKQDGVIEVLDKKGEHVKTPTVLSSTGEISLMYFSKEKTYKIFCIEGSKVIVQNLVL